MKLASLRCYSEYGSSRSIPRKTPTAPHAKMISARDMIASSLIGNRIVVHIPRRVDEAGTLRMADPKVD